jgi:RNA polymerase sigma-70 factor, ECF subfamily
LQPGQSAYACPLHEVDANDLVDRARGGCDDAFAELARRYFPRLVQLVLPRLHSSSHMDAEDVAQESLFRVFQNIDKFDPSYRFSTWLYTIAIRIAIDHNRGYRRRMALVESRHDELECLSRTQANQTLDLESTESVGSIWKTAERALGKSHYTAMWLRFSEELSIEEIAKVLGKTQVGVRVLLHRARSKMLKELSKDVPNDSLVGKARPSGTSL